MIADETNQPLNWFPSYDKFCGFHSSTGEKLRCRINIVDNVNKPVLKVIFIDFNFRFKTITTMPPLKVKQNL